jgi:hypothetical protein
MPKRVRPTADQALASLIGRAEQAWGPERAEAIRALGTVMPTGLAMLAGADLRDADEPDFLRRDAP